MQTINRRLKALEAAGRLCGTRTYLARELQGGLWEVSDPVNTGALEVMPLERLNRRPKETACIYLAADGGIYLDEPE